MPRSIDDAIRDARVILNDEEGERYTDAELISDMNSAISMTKMLRPDVFRLGETLPEFVVGDLNQSPPTDFPLPDIFYQSFVYYLAGNAELRDDEFAVDNRAMTLLAAYRRNLTGSP
ncbi:MAG: hypothetical protein JRF07_05320 [Deltaproteobacteria bacterium]|jgi:hypothetical protein|nr:hypothetical protein [Deltaproteobacteria bacterium]